MKTNKLTALDITKLYNAEFAQLVARFLEDFSKSSLEANTYEDLNRLMESLRANLPDFNAASDQVRASSESAKIVKADSERDATLRAFKDALKAYRSTKENGEKEAYMALDLLLSEYKGVETNSYEMQTNRLANLVERLQSNSYKKHVDELAIGKFVERLSQANTYFDELFANRSFLLSQRKKYNANELRKVLVSDYRKICNYVEAVANVRQEAFYTEMLAIINNSRKYFADTVLSRRTKKKEAKKEGTKGQ